MKAHLHHLFEFIGRPENFQVSVILIALYAIFFIMIGMLLSLLIFRLVSKSFRKTGPASFEDYAAQVNPFKVRKVK